MLPLPAFSPLDTLPSWPVVNDPTVLEMLLLTLFIPLVITLVLTLVILGSGWRPKN
jgi:hypothetical protein